MQPGNIIFKRKVLEAVGACTVSINRGQIRNMPVKLAIAMPSVGDQRKARDAAVQAIDVR